jgi:hypothetical protein
MDPCAECGYDYAGLPRTALAPSITQSALQHAARLAGVEDRLRTGPAAGVWSPLEYACRPRRARSPHFPTRAVRDVDRIVRHTLHELVHHLMDVDRGLGGTR